MHPKQLNREKKKRSKNVPWLGRMLARLPSSWPVLYPLYLAAQLDTVQEQYWSRVLPPAFDETRIAFLSDIHFGPLLGEDRVRALADRVNALHPDYVILGGDYGQNSHDALRFFELKPGFRANQAVLAVLGNHDRMDPEENAPRLLAAMRADGVTPLVNEAYRVTRNGQSLVIAGADDYYCGSPNLPLLAAACRNGDFSIFVCHEPDLLPKTQQMPEGPFYQLALCGHTHGGQVALFGHAIFSSSLYGDRYLSGWYQEAGADILVTNGVGTSGLPVRLGARPQLHLITLKRETDSFP